MDDSYTPEEAAAALKRAREARAPAVAAYLLSQRFRPLRPTATITLEQARTHRAEAVADALRSGGVRANLEQTRAHQRHAAQSTSFSEATASPSGRSRSA